ncbi:MAG: hypothetical protein V1779_07155 [bacterium]
MKKMNLFMGFFLIFTVLFCQLEQLKGEPSLSGTNYDICELYMDSKPIINYDLMFGDVIKATSFFVKDRKQPCINYSYEYDRTGKIIKKRISHVYSGMEVTRDYKYDENGLILEVIEQRENFKKKISFYYNYDLTISEVRESVISGADDPLFIKFDELKYKMDNRGNIIEVRGVKEKLMGLSSKILMLKAYDYDERNRLKAIRDFMNPNDTQLFSFDDYVNK